MPTAAAAAAAEAARIRPEFRPYSRRTAMLFCHDYEHGLKRLCIGQLGQVLRLKM